jgi:predicted AAA+ superfamily ATPase
VPEIFRAIKLAVDRRRNTGSFLLTGSANVMLLPKLSESLAGRMEIVSLWPLSQGEIEGTAESFIDKAFAEDWRQEIITNCDSQAHLIARVVRGGFPEPVQAGRLEWFASYITAILQRDIRELANIERLTTLPDLLAVLAARVSGLLNVSDVSSTTGVPNTTVTRYLSVLEAAFQILRLRPWSPHYGKRFTKSPKLYFTDTGLASFLLGVTSNSLERNRDLLGRLLENFVLLELMKQAGWSERRTQIYHFRTQKGVEVDFVIEDNERRVVGVEVKLKGTVKSDDLRGLNYLESLAGDRFVRGIVLYSGERVYPLSQKAWAVPLNALWQ